MTRIHRSIAAAALVMTSAVGPASIVAAAPPEDTFELHAQVDLLTLTQGDTIPFTGTCYSELVGPGDQALVMVSRVVSSGGVEPFSFYASVSVNRSDATFGGSLAVPLEAPPGGYTFGGNCSQDDQAFPLPTSAAVITGDPEVPQPTTPPPTTSVPGGAPPGGPSAPPATPVPAAAALTG